MGNRTVHDRTLTSTTVTTYTYDAANRLDYFYQDGVQTDLTWDANGNLLAQGTSVYTWDAANRLVSAEVGGVGQHLRLQRPRPAHVADGEWRNN